MKRINLYPVGTWVAWTLAVPLAGLVLGIAVVSMTDVGDFPFDNPDLWWLGGAVPLASLLCLYGYQRRRRALRRFASDDLNPLLAARVRPARQALKSGLQPHLAGECRARAVAHSTVHRTRRSCDRDSG